MTGDKVPSIILVVEDDEGIAALIHSNLVNAGFSVVHAADGAESLQKAGELIPALIILEMMIPGMPGKEVLRSIKSTPTTGNVPVIVLSAQSEEIDRIVALELGADDYVAKPFSARELALRVRAILSRRVAREPRQARQSVGMLRLDAEDRIVSVNGKPADLSSWISGYLPCSSKREAG